MYVPKSPCATSPGDYKGITLNSPLNTFPYMVIMDRCGAPLDHSPMQFGFTAGYSTTDVTFVLKEAIS